MEPRASEQPPCLAWIPRDFFVQWFRRHGRTFPWRQPGTSPYGVLVAEMLLRQTRASMVPPVWEQLIQRYPGPTELSTASLEDLYQIVRQLGLGRQRATALRSMAQAVTERFAGKIPENVKALESLPHVGPYVSRAVCCFAFGEQLAIVDSNVLRVLSRLTGCQLPRDIRRFRARCAWEMAARLLPEGAAREHNLGLLDFAAAVCKPVSPRCAACPLAGHCYHAGAVLARSDPRRGEEG